MDSNQVKTYFNVILFIIKILTVLKFFNNEQNLIQAKGFKYIPYQIPN